MENKMILHTSRNAEAQLREHGFDIPMFPETGEVSFGGNVVGRADNFNGITIRDEFEDEIRLVLSLQDEIKMGVWNIPAYAR